VKIPKLSSRGTRSTNTAAAELAMIEEAREKLVWRILK
jgi:hypothetical protein